MTGMNCAALAPVPMTATRLPVEVEASGPARRMERRPREGVPAVDLGEVRPVELAGGADHGIHGDVLDLAVRPPGAQRPRAVVVGPCHRLDLRLQAHVLQQAVLLGEGPEVAAEDVLGGVVHRPVVPLGEGVAVVVVGVVDPASRIGVLPPRAAHVRVLLDHDEVDAGLLEAVRGEQPRHAGADDRHGVRQLGSELVSVPGRRPQVLARDGELLLQERDVLAHHLGARGELHHLHQVVLGRRRRPR